ncbi:hypothetical protein BC830DRAFT_1172363 [Chytriomyces sp. MP71]|nr:hypothetical protein BC830DRAFT_1172363 [Chytriomyces sp. MP71]
MPLATYPVEFLRRIPKTDLHCHLDGSIRIQTLIDLAKAEGVELPAFTVEGLEALVFKEQYNSLEEYLEGFHYTEAVLRNEPNLERVAFEMAEDQFNVGIRYFEVRYAPQLHAIPGQLSVEQVIEAVDRGLKRAVHEFNAKPEVVSGEEPEYGYGQILCAMRFFTPEFSPWFKSFWEVHQFETPKRIYGLAAVSLVATCANLRSKTDIPICAFDIAGAEKGFPASDFQEAFKLAHKKFLFKTVHAGEAYGPESIFQAIADCHAERIGHGFHLFDTTYFTNAEKSEEDRNNYISGLIKYMSNQRICIEVCLSSNLQTMPEATLLTHPVKKMIEHKIAFSLCSDNMTVSRTHVLKELELAIGAFDLSPRQVKDITITGFKRSFMHGEYVHKRAYVRRIINFYEKLEKEYGIVTPSI